MIAIIDHISITGVGTKFLGPPLCSPVGEKAGLAGCNSFLSLPGVIHWLPSSWSNYSAGLVCARVASVFYFGSLGDFHLTGLHSAVRKVQGQTAKHTTYATF